MKKLAVAAAIGIAGILSSTAASAAVYRFTVTSTTCVPRPGQSCDNSKVNAMDGIEIGFDGLTSSIYAESRDPWSGDEWPGTYMETKNFWYANIDALGTQLDVPNRLCRAVVSCTVDMSFVDTVTDGVQGFFWSSDWNDLFTMATSMAEWRGYWGSADQSIAQHNFTGYWVKISDQTAEIPEPSPVALLGAGLAGLMWVRRRKDTREQA